jgi:DNA-binding transcriptional MerR regulator
MRSLKTREAADLLNVSPNTLRTWERKFGYPKPLRSAGRHRAYTYAEIIALRDALRRGLSVASAISVVREGIGADTEALVSSLDAFNLPGADRAMEASLALRSMERSIEEMLLPALDEVRRRDGPASTTWAVAHRWGVDWLGRAQRISAAPTNSAGILIGDASGGELGPSRPSIRALELFCARAGLGVLVLPVEALTRLPAALAAIEPVYIVIAGGHATDEKIARWAYAVRQIDSDVPFALYLRPTREDPPKLTAHALSPVPIRAQAELLELVAARCAKLGASVGETNRLAHSS